MKKTIQKKEIDFAGKGVTAIINSLSQKEPEEWWTKSFFDEFESRWFLATPGTLNRIKVYISKLLSQQRTQTIEEIKKAIEQISMGGEITMDTAERNVKITDYLDSLK